MTKHGHTNGKKSEKQRPVHEIRLGRIRAAIWQNETENGLRHNVTISRLYKDDEHNQWRDSSSFGRDDLPLVAKVADQALLWIYSLGQAQATQDAEEGEESAEVPVGAGTGGGRPF